jgi:hypothetical protein
MNQGQPDNIETFFSIFPKHLEDSLRFISPRLCRKTITDTVDEKLFMNLHYVMQTFFAECKNVMINDINLTHDL